MNDDFISFAEVKRITGYSRAQIDRLEREPKYMGADPFPVRFVYGNRRVLWKRAEVIAWRDRRIKRDGTRLPPVPPKGSKKSPIPEATRRE